MGRQAADLPLFSIDTDDCMSEYRTLKERGVEFDGEPQFRPYGTGVLLLHVLFHVAGIGVCGCLR